MVIDFDRELIEVSGDEITVSDLFFNLKMLMDHTSRDPQGFDITVTKVSVAPKKSNTLISSL